MATEQIKAGTGHHILTEAREHALSLLSLLPELRTALGETSGGSGRLVIALEGTLIRLIERLVLAEQFPAAQQLPDFDISPGLEELYGIWKGVEISDEAIETAKFQLREGNSY